MYLWGDTHVLDIMLKGSGNVYVPRLVDGVTHAQAIFAGPSYFAACLADGSLVGWGAVPPPLYASSRAGTSMQDHNVHNGCRVCVGHISGTIVSSCHHSQGVWWVRWDDGRYTTQSLSELTLAPLQPAQGVSVPCVLSYHSDQIHNSVAGGDGVFAFWFVAHYVCSHVLTMFRSTVDNSPRGATDQLDLPQPSRFDRKELWQRAARLRKLSSLLRDIPFFIAPLSQFLLLTRQHALRRMLLDVVPLSQKETLLARAVEATMYRKDEHFLKVGRNTCALCCLTIQGVDRSTSISD